MSDPKPKGSGYFAVISGLLFFCAFLASLFFDNFVGKPDPTIGQTTIQFVMGIVNITIALLAPTMKLS